jgi:hypothetical protein
MRIAALNHDAGWHQAQAKSGSMQNRACGGFGKQVFFTIK